MDEKDLQNRFTYHPPVDSSQTSRYEAIRNRAYLFAEYLNEVCPESREKSLAITHLEDSVMWAIASIARHE